MPNIQSKPHRLSSVIHSIQTHVSTRNWIWADTSYSAPFNSLSWALAGRHLWRRNHFYCEQKPCFHWESISTLEYQQSIRRQSEILRDIALRIVEDLIIQFDFNSFGCFLIMILMSRCLFSKINWFLCPFWICGTSGQFIRNKTSGKKKSVINHLFVHME